jgi:hypothetical protein
MLWRGIGSVQRLWREFRSQTFLGSVEALFCGGCRTADHEANVLGRHLLPDDKTQDFLVLLTQLTESSKEFLVLLIAYDQHIRWESLTPRMATTYPLG